MPSEKHYMDRVCRMCGKTFTPLSPNGCWCEECRPKRLAEQREKYRVAAIERRKDKDDSFHTCDSPKVIEGCLNCTKQKCNGNCKDVRFAVTDAKRKRKC